MRIQGQCGYAALALCVGMALAVPAVFAQPSPPFRCLPNRTLEIYWRETFLLTKDLAAAGWHVIGEPSWKVTREALDAGNGDLFDGTTIITLPEDAANGSKDYLVTTDVWNTQRDGLLFVAVRFRDPRNYYALEYLSGDGRLAVLLVKILEGERTVLQRVDSADTAVHIPDLTYGAGKGSASLITIGAFGNRICASLGRTVFLDAEDDSLPDGGIALGQARYHPYFDDVTVYLSVSPEEAAHQVAGEHRTFRIPVPDRDEGNAVVMDLNEMGLGPVELRNEDGGVAVIVGPLKSRQEIYDLRGFLEVGGYASEEIEEPGPTPSPGIESATSTPEAASGIKGATPSPEIAPQVEGATVSPEMAPEIEGATQSSEIAPEIEGATSSPETASGIENATGSPDTAPEVESATRSAEIAPEIPPATGPAEPGLGN